MEGIARVFFREGEVGFQALSDHQGLVVRLLEAWRVGDGPLALHPGTRERVLEAARHHDDGKRFTFRIEPKEGGPGLTYSFRGHRFRVNTGLEDPYVRALIQGHHDYSTREVVNGAAAFQGLLAQRFPEDLFLLMMADQLEAELAVRLFEGKEGEVRPFVEFDLIPLGEGRFALDPWPFKGESLPLDFRAYFRPYGGEEAGVVEGWGRELARALDGGRLPQAFREERCSVELIPLREWRDSLSPEAFYALFGLKPNPLQEKVFRQAEKDLAHLLLAPTGTGKTEAALFPGLARGERVVFVLPTRSLADDLEARFLGYLEVLARHEGRPKALIVDTGARQVRTLVHPDGRREERRERHLYHGDIVLTTLDKLLYHYFGFAEGVKSYTFPRRIHDRRTLFVFDEAHLYEATAWANFRRLVDAFGRAGVHFLLMSATMPRTYQEELEPSLLGVLEAEPLAARPRRLLFHLPQGDLGELAQEHYHRKGKRVLLAVEEVKEAVGLYRALKGEGVFLYHGRLAEAQRRKVYAEVKKRDEEGKPYLLITTPAIEVGVDLDAEVLLTALCPPENLLQRLGRVNRRGKGVGEAYVVGQEYPEYLGTLPEGYLELLEDLSGQDLAQGGEERLREAIRYPRYWDPRAETLFEVLQEYVYGLDLTHEPAHRKGFVATRGWTPSVLLRVGDDEVEVPVDRLVGGEGELQSTKVWERFWPDREKGWVEREQPLRWGGELCGRTLVVDYPKKEDYDPEIGFAELPKVFLRLKSHSDPIRVWICYNKKGGDSPQEGVVDAEGGQGSPKVVLWYLAESAWAEPESALGASEEGETEETEEEEP